jgi:uncharacterized protein YjbI with pentapeptide repeats
MSTGSRWRYISAFGIALIASCASAQAPRALSATAVTPPPPSIDVCTAAGSGQDFSNRDLRDTNFHAYPGTLVGAKFDKSDLRGANFDGQDLTGASFKDATLGASANGPAVFTHTKLDHTCFAGANLNDAQFEFATIHCADFSNTSMVDAQFGPRQSLDHAADCRTRFIGTTLDVHAITPDHWPFVDFTHAKFKNYAPANFNLKGLPLTGVMLAYTVLPGIDMTAANLTAADLSHAELVNAVLEDATLNGALLIGTNLSVAHLRCARFRGSKGDTNENPNGACQANPESSQLLVSADLTNVQLRRSHLEHATFNYAQMRGAILDRATATGASFINVSFVADDKYLTTSFVGTDLSGAKFSGAHLDQVSFDGTILPGADFSGTTLQGTSFENAIAPGASFSQAKLQGINFKYAVLQSANFQEAVIQTGPNSAEVMFTCADLGGANFTAADVKQARFTSAVMPAPGDCCPGTDNPYCGTIALTKIAYGPTRFPPLTATNDMITCPNGDHAPCTTWSVPGWKTDLCNVPISNRTPRIIWTKPDCGGTTPTGIVQFDDENLHKCVSDAAGGVSVITQAIASTITDLRCAGRGIEHLGGLDAFTNLVTLNLSYNNLTQFDVSLPLVRDLRIAGNKLATLNVASMTGLSYLDASNNLLISVGGLGVLSPQVLDLSQNQFTNLDLAVQSALTYANLSGNHLTSILDSDNPDLSRAPNLAYLDVSNNTLTTIGNVKNNNRALASLFLGCNPSFDCHSLGDVDPSSPVIQNSNCAVLNKQSNTWAVRANPQCP